MKLMMAVCDVVDDPSLMNHGLYPWLGLRFLFVRLFFLFIFLVEVVDDESFPSMHQTIKHTKELERADDGTSCHLYGRDRLLRTQHFPFEILCVCFFRFLVS